MNRIHWLRVAFVATLGVALWACSPPIAPAKDTQTFTAFPPDSPEAAVQTLMEVDFSGGSRQDPEKYYTLLEKYISDGDGDYERKTFGDRKNTFDSCSPSVVIMHYRILGGRYAAGETAASGTEVSPIYLVSVEAEVVTLEDLDKIAPFALCSWTSLEVINTKTGEVERHADATDPQAILNLIRSFGKVRPEFDLHLDSGHVRTTRLIVVDPHRRRWRFQVPLVREPKRIGQFDSTIDSVQVVQGWVFKRPYLPVHEGVEAKLRWYERRARRNNNLLRACAGEEEPVPPFYRQRDCTAEQIAFYKEILPQLDAMIALYRSLRAETTK